MRRRGNLSQRQLSPWQPFIQWIRQTKWKQKQVKSSQEQPVELLRHGLKLQLMQLIQQDQGPWMQLRSELIQMWEWVFTRENLWCVLISSHSLVCWSVAGASWCELVVCRVTGMCVQWCACPGLSSIPVYCRKHISLRKKLEEPIANMHSLLDKKYIKYQWHALILLWTHAIKWHYVQLHIAWY